MIKNIFFQTTLLSIFFSCSHKQNGVFLNELPSYPVVSLRDNVIYMHIENSIKNSSKSIYKIDVFQQGEDIQIKVCQRLSGLPFLKYQNDFSIDLKKFGLPLGSQFNLTWVDPDGGKTVLDSFEVK